MKTRNNILLRQYLSEGIDLILCFIPSIGISYFISINAMLNIQNVFPSVYFIYGLLSTFLGHGKTIGDMLNNLVMIRINTGRTSTILFFGRQTIKVMILFMVSNYEMLNIASALMIFFLIFPFRFQLHKYVCYSLLSYGSKTTYVDDKLLES